MTTTEKNAMISQAILIHVANGLNVRDAIDAVLGQGMSAAIIDDLYYALRAKAGL